MTTVGYGDVSPQTTQGLKEYFIFINVSFPMLIKNKGRKYRNPLKVSSALI